MAQSHQIQELLNRKDYLQAEKILNEQIEQDPGNAEWHYFRGVSQYFQGKVGPAIEHLKHALELDPQHTDASVCLSVLFSDIGKYDEARDVFEQANHTVLHSHAGHTSRIDRKFSLKHMELADMYFRYRRYDEAVEEYDRAVLLDPKNRDIRIRRAKAYAKKGYISRAIQELQELKTEYPHEPSIRIQLGLIHHQNGNVLDADLEWEGVLELDPTNEEAKNYLSMTKI